MNKITACVVTMATLIAAPAFAADMAVKAPAPAPAPVYNWTGWYVGVNAGASFGNVKTDFNAPVTISFQLPSVGGPGSTTTGFLVRTQSTPTDSSVVARSDIIGSILP